ncbi:hypothetical protein [Nocardia sp. NBC_01730]|uniref:hypothetical protein n=1 Tax=Nocardia sp. NBC_01730 TaxID=2975998 RepID=UPI003FA3476D
MLWNTGYIDAAVDRLRTDRNPVRNEDVARLSPLSAHPHQHPRPLCLQPAYRPGATPTA